MNFDKIVKLACKPKSAAPKTKYLDPIIAATYSDDGTLQDVCRALAPKLQETNVIVVLKALIVLHTMIRNGHTDNTLNYIASSDILRLRHVANGERHGYPLPENLSNYAAYLESRARAYRDLKHDAIRVQSESNRDRHLAGGSRSGDGPSRNGQPSRSKTVMGRKLRVMTVEKGLLRETKIVQKQVDALLGCRSPLTRTKKFFMDSLEDELTLSALSLLVKDLLILFSAENEGVINVLEHYFEMSFIDAEQALAIYKYFCEQTERVVEYLAIARKLSNLINVPIPNLKHAPLSLANALDEYLHDPNFEQNRIEYKTNKALADGKIPNKAKPQSAPSSGASQPAAPTSSPPVKANVPSIDFFNSIEEQQPTMFNPQTESPNTTYFYQNQGQALNPGLNPFRASMVVPQMTGIPGGTQPYINAQPMGLPGASPFPILAQTTGMPFLNMQHTATPFNHQHSASPFANGAHNTLSSASQETQNAFLRPQPVTFLQPQLTGSNPFRQSMFLPQFTGTPMGNTSGIGVAGLGASLSPPALQQPQAIGFSHFVAQQSPMTPGPDTTKPNSPFAGAMINRPASTPAGHSNPPAIKPLVPHVTGSRNPFGQPRQSSPPPVPKAPTIQELLAARANEIPLNPQQQQATPTGVSPQQPFSTGAFGTSSGFSPFRLTENQNQNMSFVASSFALGNHELSKNPASFTLTSQPTGLPQLTAQNTSTTTTSGYSDAFSALSLNSPAPSTTGTAITSVSGLNTNGPLQPQAMGFAGLKPFKPSSAFGASLMESLPTVPGSGAATPSGQGSPKLGALNSASTLEMSSSTSTLTVPSFSVDGPSLNAQPTGLTGLSSLSPLGRMNTLDPNLRGGGVSTVGVGLRPQPTGTANPFRASMVSPQMTGALLSSTSGSGISTGASLFGGGAGGNGSSFSGLQGSGFGTAPFKPTLTTIPSFTGGSTLPVQHQQPSQQTPQAQNSLI